MVTEVPWLGAALLVRQVHVDGMKKERMPAKTTLGEEISTQVSKRGD